MTTNKPNQTYMQINKRSGEVTYRVLPSNPYKMNMDMMSINQSINNSSAECCDD